MNSDLSTLNVLVVCALNTEKKKRGAMTCTSHSKLLRRNTK